MIEIVTADITTLDVDAIVNAANEGLRGGGGVDGAIHRAAGPGLLADLRQYDRCATGDAVLTAGHRLTAAFVIHSVGPVWRGGDHRERELLRSAYNSAFRLARSEPLIRSIAFPAISTGIFGFPKREAAEIALSSMLANEADFERVIACLFDDASAALYRTLLAERVR